MLIKTFRVEFTFYIYNKLQYLYGLFEKHKIPTWATVPTMKKICMFKNLKYSDLNTWLKDVD